jgi:agmatinase
MSDEQAPVSEEDTPAFMRAGHGPAFAGVHTFGRYEHTREIGGADIVVLGMPFDLGAIHRPGARFGPAAIRKQSVYAGALRPIYPWEHELGDAVRVVDYGDVTPIPGMGAVESLLAEGDAAIAEVLAAGASPLVLGGDHTIPHATVPAVAREHGRLALVHLDSHQDSLDADALAEDGRMVNHGTFATTLAKDGHIDGASSAQVYIRTTMDNPGGYTILDANQALQQTPEELARRVAEIVGDAPVYLSVDLDSVDPAFAPGVGTPVPGGPSSSDVRRFLRALDGLNIVAADLVELNPQVDPGEITAVLAAFIGYDLLHLLASARQRR